MGTTMHVAKYQHMSLYSFKPEAARAVIASFAQAITDPTVHCWFDATSEVKFLGSDSTLRQPADRLDLQSFMLECPSSLGAACDASLSNSLSLYIKNEIEDAEREQRAPLIEQFPESRFTSLDVLPQDDMLDQPTDISAPPSVRPRLTHLVHTEPGEANCLRSFHLHELPDLLLERTLVERDVRVPKLFNTYCTWRTVKHDENGGYVFNGRTGAGQSSIVGNAKLLGLAPFLVLRDQRDVKEELPTSVDKTWKFVGAPVTVEQWVNGMGQTKQVDVGERPEMSKDARQHLAGRSFNALGRARIVKGADLLSGPSDAVTLDITGDQSKRPFSSLLNMSEATSDGEESNSASDNSDSATSSGATRRWDSLFSDSKRRPAKISIRRPSLDWNIAVSETMPWPSKVLTAKAPAPPGFDAMRLEQQTMQATATGKTNPKTRESEVREVSVEETSFPLWGWGEAFAKVDPIGLTANTGNTAAWEEQNHQRQRPGSSVRSGAPRLTGSASRSHTAKGGPLPPETMHTQPSSRPKLSSRAATSVMNSSNRSKAPRDSWVKKDVKPDNPLRRLVDDSVQNLAASVQVPPGLLPRRKREIKPPVNLAPAETKTGILIDLNESYLDSPLSSAEPYPAASYCKEALESRAPEPLHVRPDTPHQGRLDYGIVERRQVIDPRFVVKRRGGKNRAMNTRGKPKQKAKPKTAKAELPLPNALACPRSKAENTPLTGFGRERRKVKSEETYQHSQVPIESKPHSFCSGHLSQITDCEHAFGQSLLEATTVPESPAIMKDEEEEEEESVECIKIQYKLVGQVGIILTRHRKRASDSEICDPHNLEVRLNDVSRMPRTKFLTRLTSSAKDGADLLSLSGDDNGDCCQEATYEIFVRDMDGTHLRVVVPSHNNSCFEVRAPDKVVSEAVVHFPTHVWDARFLLLHADVQHNFPSGEAIANFVASMHTEGQVPTFTAALRSRCFFVDRVYAKQIITRGTENIKFRLTLTRDLLLETVQDSIYNFRARALAQDEMIESQRLWYEVEWETDDLSRAKDVQTCVTEIIRRMDGVGLRNSGPIEQGEMDAEELSEEEMKHEKCPFW